MTIDDMVSGVLEVISSEDRIYLATIQSGEKTEKYYILHKDSPKIGTHPYLLDNGTHWDCVERDLQSFKPADGQHYYLFPLHKKGIPFKTDLSSVVGTTTLSSKMIREIMITSSLAKTDLDLSAYKMRLQRES